VAERSPAAEAALQAGDTIVQVDGREVRAARLDGLRRAFRNAGQTRIVRVERLGSVPLPLRTLV
jgi:C-terminal processing protease CtpA/Prc